MSKSSELLTLKEMNNIQGSGMRVTMNGRCSWGCRCPKCCRTGSSNCWF